MKVQGAYLQCFLALSIATLAIPPVSAQALYVDRLNNGTKLLVVAQPLANVTTVAWPSDIDGGGTTISVTSGNLTLVADIETALTASEAVQAPPVIVAVGGASVPDLRAVLERLLAGRLPRPLQDVVEVAATEGRLERRLGIAGSDAEIRLEVNLPPPSDPMRSDVQVLWDLLPEVLATELRGVRSRIDGERALLEAQVESSSADSSLRQLRLGLARLSENPAVQADTVEAAVVRLRVRRQALLEVHPQSAEVLLGLWSIGGVSAVQEHLFGVDGVTAQTVREAAMTWLPRHPGNVIITLPPRSFNPRFAAPPAVFTLDNGLSAAVLGRGGAPLAAICMRPVVVPDLDDEVAATILARVARELRELEQRPGWVRVDSQPPQIQLSAAADQFSELAEVLRMAVVQAGRDDRSVMTDAGDARRRALRLMAGFLGVAEGSSLSPASLLRTGNLSLGVVAEDSEAATEAVRKFWSQGGASTGGASVGTVAPVLRTREAAIGGDSVLVVALELAAVTNETLALVVAELLSSRSEALLVDGTVEILRPFVPGHRVVLVVASASETVDVVEEGLREGWSTFVRLTSEEELAEVRRRAAAKTAAEWSGVSGRACRCAAVASGAVGWRSAADLEMATLSVPLDAVDVVLAGFADFDNLPNTGAGALPIVDIEDR
ncbi:MAG: hypothetical protein PVG92_03655 [Holophagae bacterium]